MLYSSLLATGKLYSHLREIDQTADQRLEALMPQLMKSQGVTEQLKAQNQLPWVGMMNHLKAQVEESILTELVYS